MQESDIQLAIQALYDQTAETLDSTDDDYLTRRALINRALHTWERDPGFFWDELWGRDASQTVAAGLSDYPAPGDFVRAGGFVKLYDSAGTLLKTLPVLKPGDAQARSDGDSYAYFTGSPSAGFTLTINPAPKTGDNILGATIKYDYYKSASEYANTTDVSEIPDTEFLIHSVVAELHKSDRNFTGYQTSLEEAQDRLKAMENAHVAQINWQDTPGDLSSGGFGW